MSSARETSSGCTSLRAPEPDLGKCWRGEERGVGWGDLYGPGCLDLPEGLLCQRNRLPGASQVNPHLCLGILCVQRFHSLFKVGLFCNFLLGRNKMPESYQKKKKSLFPSLPLPSCLSSSSGLLVCEGRLRQKSGSGRPSPRSSGGHHLHQALVAGLPCP